MIRAPFMFQPIPLKTLGPNPINESAIQFLQGLQPFPIRLARAFFLFQRLSILLQCYYSAW